MEQNSLKALFPDIASEWDYEKNDILKPEMFSSHSNIKVWWKCQNNHSWKVSIDARTSGGKNRICPYCANVKVWIGYNDLASKRPDLIAEWDFDKNVSVSPESVTPGSGKKAWWKCVKCGHSWLAEISSRNKGSGCPKCGIMSGVIKRRELHP